MSITPYWTSRDGLIAVYHAPFEDVLTGGGNDRA